MSEPFMAPDTGPTHKSDTPQSPPTGRAPRVYLTPTLPQEIDEAFLAMFLNTGAKNKYFRASGREFTRAELVRFCEDGLKNGDVFYYSIRAREDDAVIGAIRIGPIDFKNSVSDMVTLIGDTRSRGKGLGVEAIRLGNQTAFDKHGLRKLHGGVMERNIGSLKAYTRAGWIEEGRLTDHCLVDGEPCDWIIISMFNPNWRAGADASPREKAGVDAA